MIYRFCIRMVRKSRPDVRSEDDQDHGFRRPVPGDLYPVECIRPAKTVMQERLK
jgi:hypothetical protein